MSTEQRDVTPPMGEGTQPGDRSLNPGATLRAAREAKGLTTAEAATSLRLPERILVLLEAGRFDQLPGDTFARGYVRSYARLLGLDANRLVLEYDRSRGIEVRERQVSGIDKMARPNKTGGMLVTWTTVIVALAIVASILLWWYDSQPDRSVDDIAGIATQALDEVQVDAMSLPEDFTTDSTVAGSVDAGAGSEPLPEDAEAAVDGAPSEAAPMDALAQGSAPLTADPMNDTAVTSEATPSAPVNAEAETPASPATTEPTTEPAATAEAPGPQGTAQGTPTPEASEQTPVTAGSGLQMQFSADCWVQVTGPGGASLHSGLMRAGQSLSVDHQGPVDVVIGAVEAVSSITFNGEPVNTRSTRESGVVRLRLD